MLSTVLLWLLNLVNASTEKKCFAMLPIQVVKMTLTYLDVDDYFQTIQLTKFLYNQCYPDMTEVMYHYYLEWLHDPQRLITQPQDLTTLHHYVAFLRTCVDPDTRTLLERNATLQLFIGTVRPSPRILCSHANAGTEIINYFSKHPDFFNYEEIPDESGDVYEFAGGLAKILENENKFGFPLVYDPIIPRLSIYHKPFADPQSIAWQKRICLPTIFVFTDTARKQIHTKRLSAYQCVAIADRLEGHGWYDNTIFTTMVWKIPTKEDGLHMYSNAKGVLSMLTIYSEEDSEGTECGPGYQYDNEYFIQGKYADIYTKFYAFYDPTVIPK